MPEEKGTIKFNKLIEEFLKKTQLKMFVLHLYEKHKYAKQLELVLLFLVKINSFRIRLINDNLSSNNNTAKTLICFHNKEGTVKTETALAKLYVVYYKLYC